MIKTEINHIECCSKYFEENKHEYKDIQYEVFTGGLTNVVFKITFINKYNQKKEAVLKIFHNHQRQGDTVISSVINKPKILYTDPLIRFRIEEYIDSNPVDLYDDRSLIVKHLYDFHNNPDLKNLVNNKNIQTYKEFCEKTIEKLRFSNFKNIEKIIDNLKKELKLLPEIDISCIAHNDLAKGNILKCKNKEEIIFIDFEYAIKGNSEIDLACLIEEMSIDYSLFDKTTTKSNHRNINEHELIDLVKKYYKTVDKSFIEKKYNEIKKLRNNVIFFHFLWALNNLDGCDKDFDYFKYLQNRFELLKNAGYLKDFQLSDFDY